MTRVSIKINSLLALIFAINLCAALKYVMRKKNVVICRVLGNQFDHTFIAFLIYSKRKIGLMRHQN